MSSKAEVGAEMALACFNRILIVLWSLFLIASDSMELITSGERLTSFSLISSSVVKYLKMKLWFVDFDEKFPSKNENTESLKGRELSKGIGSDLKFPFLLNL